MRKVVSSQNAKPTFYGEMPPWLVRLQARANIRCGSLAVGQPGLVSVPVRTGRSGQWRPINPGVSLRP